MKMKKRALGLLLAMVMSTGLLAGCGEKALVAKDDVEVTKEEKTPTPEVEEVVEEDDGIDTSEEVELVMYLLGDRTGDFDKVFDEINTKMKDDINTTLQVKFLSWSEYEQKYPLIFASGEEFDIVYSADWAFYNAQSTKGGYHEITKEDLEKYAPMTAETMYDEAWEQAKVDGKVYMLPQNYKELTGYVYMVRGDLMDKHGIDKIENINDYEAYLDVVAKNEPQMIPLDIGSDFDMLFMFDRMWGKATKDKFHGVGPWQLFSGESVDDPDHKIMSYVDMDEYVDVVNKLADWKNRGFWSKSAVVNTTNNKESFASGVSGSALMNLNDAKSQYGQLIEAHPEWDVQVIDAMEGENPTLQSFLANGMSIFSKSKHPERALMALDLLRNDEVYHDLFAYGIEGTHYNLTSEGRVESLAASSEYPYDGNCNWGVRNQDYWKELAGGMPNYEEIYETWSARAQAGKYGTFNFNDTNVKNEVAAVNEIFKSDYKLLGLGFVDDVEKDIAKIQKRLKAAGVDKIHEEMARQVEEYLK